MTHIEFMRRVEEFVAPLPIELARVLKLAAFDQSVEVGLEQALKELEQHVRDSAALRYLELLYSSDADQIEELYCIWSLSDGSLAELENLLSL